MSRRFFTQSTIAELISGGAGEVQLQPGDVVTDAAKDFALQRGFRIVPAGGTAAATAAAPSGDLAAQVRQGVVAALGYTPDGLDAAIAGVLKR